jgi:hypothetical protein
MDRETVEEIERPFGVVAEGVRGAVRAVAEGLGALRDEMRREFAVVRSEAAREFEETRALIRLSYGELDRRVWDSRRKSLTRARLDRVEKHLAT